MRNEFVAIKPTQSVPGSSNLSLITSAAAYDPALMEKATLGKILTVSADGWECLARPLNDQSITRIVSGYEVDFARSARRMSMGASTVNGQFYRNWFFVRDVYAVGEEEPGEGQLAKYGQWVQGCGLGSRSGKASSLISVHDALRILLSTFTFPSQLHVQAGGLDPLAALRGRSAENVAGFVHWILAHSVYGESYSEHTFEEMVAAYDRQVGLIMDDKVTHTIGVGSLEGAGRCAVIVAPNGRGYSPWMEDGTDDILVSAVTTDGCLETNVHLSTLGAAPGSPAWHAAILGGKCGGELIHALNRRLGVDNTFGDVVNLGGESFRDLVAFIGEETVHNAEQWAKLIANFRSAGALPVVASTGFDMNWIRGMISDGAFPIASSINDACRWGAKIEISAIDLAEFARTSVPDNPLVKSVTMLKSGKVRVVLHEPVYPEMVLRRGVTYVEDEAGTILSYMAVHAFDLDFRGTLTQFPNAQAYEDEECTRNARHTNITSAGHVCLGDINTGMSQAEVELRGGLAMPCVADFIQMLKQCNLDSAYNRDRNFVLADPESVTEAQWNAREWSIPGLSTITNHFDFKALLAKAPPASTEPAPAEEGESE